MKMLLAHLSSIVLGPLHAYAYTFLEIALFVKISENSYILVLKR